MALVKAPLFSFKAWGSIGKTISYSSEFGFIYARKYKTPTWRNTPAQERGRRYLAIATGEWHNANYTAEDFAAWDRDAGSGKYDHTGFNRFCYYFIYWAARGNIWSRIRNVRILAVTRTQFLVTAEVYPAIFLPRLELLDWPAQGERTRYMSIGAPNLVYVWVDYLYIFHSYRFYIVNGRKTEDYGRTGLYYVPKRYLWSPSP